MKFPLLSAVARSLAAVKRWLRFTRWDRIPLLAWWRQQNLSLAPKRPPLRFHGNGLVLESLEDRALPNDPFGMVATPLMGTSLALIGAQLTPGYVLAHGWNSSATPAPAAKGSAPVVNYVVPPPVPAAPPPLANTAPAPLATVAQPTPVNDSAPAPSMPANPFASPFDADWLAGVEDVLGNSRKKPPAVGGGEPGGSSAGGDDAAHAAGGSDPSRTGALIPSAPPSGDDFGWVQSLGGSAAAAPLAVPPVAPLPAAASPVTTAPGSVPAVQASSTLQAPLNTTTSVDTGNGSTQGTAPADIPYAKPSLVANYGQTALPFTVNVGQTDPGVHFLSQSPGFGLYLTDDAAWFSLPQSDQAGARNVLQLQLQGANPHPQIVAQDELTSRSNYFIGDQSYSNVAQYGQVTYADVYPGVDLVFHSSVDRQLEYDFQVKPGGSLDAVKLAWNGASGLSVDAQGALHIQTAGGEVIENAPTLYQRNADGSQTPVQGSHVLLGNNQVGFSAVGFDPNKTLVVDPVVSYSSYFGGAGNDSAFGIAVGNDGSAYLTGSTASVNLPNRPGLIQPFGLAGGSDAFVAKLDPTGSTVVYSTYLGGVSDDQGNGIAVDSRGMAVVVGTTGSWNFPQQGSDTTTFSGTTNAFVARLTPAGDRLISSGFLGSGTTTGTAVALDPLAGYSEYVVGSQLNSFTHHQALVVFTVDPIARIQWTYTLGGATGDVNGRGIAVDRFLSPYVTGDTNDPGFTATSGVLRTALAGMTDAFVLKLNNQGTSLVYATYLGGTSVDSAKAIAVDSTGAAYVAGVTNSLNFPTTISSIQPSQVSFGQNDAFVSKLNPTATALTYSTFLGGSADDGARAIAVDAAGYATVAGYTESTTFPPGPPGSIPFPTNNALFSSNAGGRDAFVSRLNPAGTTLAYSTYLGGSATDEANGVALDLLGNAYVTGDTNSSNFATAAPVQPSNAGGYDAFITKIALVIPAPTFTSISPDTGSSSTDQITSSQNLTINGKATPGSLVTLSRRGVGVLGSASTSLSTGAFSFDYSGTTLPEGNYDFYATTALNGQTSVPSSDFLVKVDRTAPAVTLTVPATTTSRAPVIVVAARDLNGLPNGTAVNVDVDLNNDGDFADANETGNVTATLTDGQAVITLPAWALPGAFPASFPVRVRVTDLAGNQATTGAQTITLTSSGSAWTTTGQVQLSDPLDASALDAVGNVQVMHAVDLDQSPGTQQGGSPSLTYNSDSVHNLPLIQASIQTDNSQALPAHVIAQLTWNGTTQGATTFSTSGFSPGDVLTVAQQVSSAVTTTGRYTWSLLVTMDYGSPITRTVTGTAFVAAQDASALGAGWTLSPVDHLVGISADTLGNPAGQLRLFGSGGYRFYPAGASTATFTSPANDNGTLTYDGTNYTYTTPGGDSTTFNSGGYETEWQSTDQQEAQLFRYNGSNQLTGTTAIDGALATFAYSSGLLSTITATSGVTTLAYTGTDLTRITNPDGGSHSFTYDGNHHLTSDTFGLLQNNWAYAASGALHTYTHGSLTGSGGVSNPDQTVYSPAAVQGLNALTAATIQGAIRATATDGLGHVTVQELDSAGRPLQQWAPDGGRTVDTRDAAGRVLTETDPLSRTTTYTRDGAGYVLTQTNPDGTVATYAYQAAFHALTAAVDALGNRSTATYDGSGHKLTDVNALNQTTTYTYSNGLVQTVTDAAGRTTSYGYDGQRRATTVTDPLGHTTSTTYDSRGNPLTMTDVLGHVTTSLYDVMGRQTVTIDALGQRSTTTYDVSGLALKTVNVLGTETDLNYDGFNRGQTVETDLGVGSGVQNDTLSSFDAAGQATSARNPNGWWSSTTFDANGQTVAATNEAGGTSATAYDNAGQATAATNELGQLSTTGYNAQGWVTTSTDPLGNVTTYGYDAAGNQTFVTDPLGHTTTSLYDAANRVTVVIDALGDRTTTTYDSAGHVWNVSDALGHTTSYGYDAADRQTSVTEAFGTALQRTTTTTYDNAGNVLTKTDALGHTTSYAYDTLNRATTVTDALGNTTTTSYDAAGNVLTKTDARGLTVTYSYDALGRQQAMTDASNQTTSTVEDAVGNTVSTIDPASNVTLNVPDTLNRTELAADPQKQVAQSFYDAASNPSGGADELGNRSTQVTDALNRVIATTDALGNTTSYGYDAAGNQTVVMDPLGHRTTSSYDALNRVTQTTDALGDLSTVLYDALGHQTVSIDALGRRTTTAYDALNRVTQTQDALGDLTTTVYDLADNVLASVDALGRRTTMAYDADNRATQTTDALGDVSSVVYDAAGNKSVAIDARGNRTTYAYDSDERLTQTTDALNDVSTIVYDALSNKIADVNARGFRTTYSYDSNNRLTQTTDALGDLTSVVYDAAGNQIATVDARGNRTSMAYDVLNRVTATTDALGDVSTVVFDAAGNQLATVDARGDRTTYLYDALNRSIQTTDALGDVSSVVYDAVGNQLATIDARGDRTSMAYDNLNRVTQTTDALGDLSTVLYDAVGNQLATIDARSNRTSMAYDALNRATQTTDAMSNVTTVLFDAAGNQVATVDARGDRTSMSYDALNRATQTTDALGDLSTVLYDATGNKSADVNVRGFRTSYAYDGLNRLTQTTDALNDLTTILYDAAGNKTADVDARGNRTSYAYDSLNRVTKTTDALGDVSSMLYDAAGNQLATVDPRGNRTSMAYDALNRATQTTDALGDMSTVVFDAAGNKSVDVNARGFRTSYSYDALNRVTKTTDAVDDVSSVVYDAAGNQFVQIDALGNRTTTTYDSDNRATATTDALNDQSATVYDAVGNKIGVSDYRGDRTSYAYDALNRVTKTTDALSEISSVLYDAAGNQTVTIDALGNRTSMAYDALDRATQTTDALGDLSTVLYDAVGNKTADVNTRGFRTSYAYDNLNRLTQTTDALNDVSSVVYDAAGNKLADVDALSHRTSYAYDALNRATQTTDALNNASTVVFDAVGNKLADVDGRGNRTTMAYDGLNRVTQTTDALTDLSTVLYDAVGNQTATIDARGNRTTMAYDALHRVTTTTDALNHTTSTGHDAQGNVVKQTDALGDVTTLAYDALNRKLSLQGPGGGMAITYYDKAGNVTAVLDQLSQVTTSAYDALHRKTVATDALLGATTYTFDSAGNTTTLTDPDGNKTTFVYDALGRQTQETDPLGHSTTVAYDAAGRQTSSTDRLGQVRTDTYDADNRKLTETWVTSGSTVNIQSYTYDANGNQLTAQDYNGAYTMAYDALNRVTVQNEPFGQTLTNTYDSVGNRTVLTDSKGGVTTSTYNAVNLLTSRQFSDGTTPLREDWTYTATNQQATATRYSDLAGTTVVGTTIYANDSAQRVTSITDNNSAGTAVATFIYSYDQDSRLTQQVVNGVTSTYSYDYTNQLTGDGTNTYSYDANGNRTMAGYVTGADNLMLTDASGYTYTYDAANERTKKSLGASADTWTYTYNQNGQMTSVVERAAESPTATLLYSAAFTFDVFGQRIQQDVWTPTTGTITTKFGYDNGNVWVDLTSGNALAVRYARPDGTDALGARISSAGTAAWYLTDRQLTVWALTDNSGVVQDRDTYNAWGNLLTESAPTFGDRYHYDGREYDSADQFLYVRWREDDTVNNGWTSEDLIRFRGGDVNLRRDVGNGPTNATDPTGLSTLKIKEKRTNWSEGAAYYSPRVGSDEYIGDIFTDKNTGVQYVRIGMYTVPLSAVSENANATFWTDDWMTFAKKNHVDTTWAPWAPDRGHQIKEYDRVATDIGTEAVGFDMELFWHNVSVFTGSADKEGPAADEFQRWFLSMGGRIEQRDARWLSRKGLFRFKTTSSYQDTTVYLNSHYNEAEAAQQFIKEVHSTWGEYYAARNLDQEHILQDGVASDWAKWRVQSMVQTYKDYSKWAVMFYTSQLSGVQWAITLTDILQGGIDGVKGYQKDGWKGAWEGIADNVTPDDALFLVSQIPWTKIGGAMLRTEKGTKVAQFTADQLKAAKKALGSKLPSPRAFLEKVKSALGKLKGESNVGTTVLKNAVQREDIALAKSLFGASNRLRALTPEQLQVFEKYVGSQYGTHFLQDGEHLVEQLVERGVSRDVAVQMRLGHASQAEFQVLTNTGQTFIIYRKGTTAFDVVHEYAHLLHYQEVGKIEGRWGLYTSLDKEQWVFNYLRENHWDQLPVESRLEATRYLMNLGGRAWSR